MLPVIPLWMASVLYLAVAAIMVRAYLRTRDVGFVWLGAAVLIWPYVSRLLERGETATLNHRAADGQWPGFFPFSLIPQAKIGLGDLHIFLYGLDHLIGAGLLLVAVLYFARGDGDRKRRTTA